MLIINRGVDQSIYIGKNIFIKILRIDKGEVKIGIEAPREVKVLRSELLESLERGT